MHSSGRSFRRAPRRPLFSVLRRVVLPAVLLSSWLAAQGLAITHDFDLDRHPAHEVCELCIAIGDLGAAALGKGSVWAVEPNLDATPDNQAAPVAAVSASAHRARGPPAASRV